MPRVLGGLLVVLAGALVVLAVLLPRLAGAAPYAVLTGSMSPELPPGTLVVVRPVDTADVRIGDVLTFQLRSGDHAVVTHRVIGTRQGEQGREFLTQGDANPAPDADAVREVQVRGEVWYSLPWVGRLSVLLEPGDRQVLTTLIGGVLGVYAGFSLLLAAFRARRRREVGERERVGVGP